MNTAVTRTFPRWLIKSNLLWRDSPQYIRQLRASVMSIAIWKRNEGNSSMEFLDVNPCDRIHNGTPANAGPACMVQYFLDCSGPFPV